MTELWAADVEVTAEIARTLINGQFSELSDARIEPLGEGWDNAAFLIGGTYVFRFPRRTVAVPLIAREIAILPLLAPHLPVPISVPCFAGKSSPSYPWPFAGYRAFAGSPLSALELSSRAYVRLGIALGTFLRALHGIDPGAALASGLSGDEIGRLDHSMRMPKLDERFNALSDAGLIGDTGPLLEFLNAVAPDGPRPERAAIVHGDLYAKHIFVDRDGSIGGIIDWGDIHYGDPAVDISIAFEVLPPQARPAFATAYGSIDERTWELARYRAIYHAALVAYYGYRIADQEIQRAGLNGLRYAAP